MLTGRGPTQCPPAPAPSLTELGTPTSDPHNPAPKPPLRVVPVGRISAADHREPGLPDANGAARPADGSEQTAARLRGGPAHSTLTGRQTALPGGAGLPINHSGFLSDPPPHVPAPGSFQPPFPPQKRETHSAHLWDACPPAQRPPCCRGPAAAPAGVLSSKRPPSRTSFVSYLTLIANSSCQPHQENC